jgi:hypothetical protein
LGQAFGYGFSKKGAQLGSSSEERLKKSSAGRFALL